MLAFLKEEGVSPVLLEELEQFRRENPPELPERCLHCGNCCQSKKTAVKG